MTETRRHDIIVIGASAGGLDALQRLCRALPADLPAVIAIVQHTAPSGPGMLAQILARDCRLPVVMAEDGTPPGLGTVYVAPPDRHLLFDAGRLRVVRGPRENLHRPAIDPLFRSAAAAYGPRVVGVVLTGMLDDGTAGLQAIRKGGGTILVQDPSEAQFPSMPEHALANVAVDHCLPLDALAAKLVELAGEMTTAAPSRDARSAAEAAMALGSHTEPSTLDGMGRLSSFTCPECHGSLWELDDEAVLRWRCHVGHAFTIDSLREGQTEFQERALWTALRALEEQATLLARLGRRAHDQANAHSAKRFDERAAAFRADAEVLRDMLVAQPAPASEEGKAAAAATAAGGAG